MFERFDFPSFHHIYETGRGEGVMGRKKGESENFPFVEKPKQMGKHRE